MRTADTRNSVLPGLSLAQNLDDLLLGKRARLHRNYALVEMILTHHVLLITGACQQLMRFQDEYAISFLVYRRLDR